MRRKYQLKAFQALKTKHKAKKKKALCFVLNTWKQYSRKAEKRKAQEKKRACNRDFINLARESIREKFSTLPC